MTSLQLFDNLPPHIEAALRESIQRFGVLVPVVRDQHGRTIDGHHRQRLADEIGVKYRVDVVIVKDDDEAKEIARTLNSDRRHLTAEQRQAVVAALAAAGHSERAIAGALGVSKTTVHEDISQLVTNDQLEKPERTIGLDGKSRPARRPTIVPAKDTREAEKVADALEAVPLPMGDVVDAKTIQRQARNVRAATFRDGLRGTLPPTCDLRLGDFRDVLADLPDNSVDLILTDPPYPAEFLPLWSDLAAFAARVLRAGGSLAAMSGQAYLPDVVSRLSSAGLTYQWTLAYLTPGGQAVQVFPRRVHAFWKPVLWFVKGDYGGRWVGDVAKSAPNDNDKRHHHWGQSESGMRDLVERLAEPGQLVCDPFAGGGTTAIVALDYGCAFVGAELDEEHYASALRRFAA